MIVSFKKGAHLSPTSKLKFYSDAWGSKLLCEINAGTEGKWNLQPLMFNHSQIWIHYDKGTTAILPKDL